MENYNKCIKCGLNGTFICTRCNSLYCSKQCQVDDWPAHKKYCADLTHKLTRIRKYVEQYEDMGVDALIPHNYHDVLTLPFIFAYLTKNVGSNIRLCFNDCACEFNHNKFGPFGCVRTFIVDYSNVNWLSVVFIKLNEA